MTLLRKNPAPVEGKNRLPFNKPEVAPVHSKPAAMPVALDYVNMGFDVEDNMEGVEARLPQVGIIHQAQLFKLPDESSVRELVGVIVDSNRINSYWRESLTKGGAGNRPDCFSFDGAMPHGDEHLAPSCITCKLNKFGSKVGDNGEITRGKACKNGRRVHIILDGQNIPFRLAIPSTSLRAWDDYMVLLAGKQIPYPAVVTRITLEKADNKDGIRYSRCVFELVNPIEDVAILKEIGGLRLKFRGAMRHQDITAAEADIERRPEDPFGDDIPEPGARG